MEQASVNKINIKSVFKQILIALLIFLVLIVFLNWKYFWVNLGFSFNKQGFSSAAVNKEIEPNIISLPSLGIKAPIVYVNAINNSLFDAALAHGVVHYPDTAKIGEVGNAYIFGHSSDLDWSRGDYKTVFALLPRINIGAEIIVSSESGEVFTYVVVEKFIASANEVSLLSQQTNNKKILTLQTSWPLGTALKRYIVKAEIKE